MGKDPSWSSKHSIEMLFIAQDEHFIDCDILVYNKCIATPVEVLKQLQAQGMKIVVDIDDYWILPPGNPYAPQWNGSGNDKLTEEHIKIANLVICTSMRLQEKVRELNKNTVVIPNALPFGDGQFAPGEKIVTDKMSFLYAGGVGHLADVKLLEGKFKKIGSDPYIRNNAQFILAGYEKSVAKKFHTKEDRDKNNSNFNLENITGPYDHMKLIFSHTGSYKILPTLPLWEYMHHYDHADVGLVPLTDSSWHSYISELKLLELATRDIPAICSNVSPYSDLRPCEGVCFVETQDDWLKYIRKSIKEKDWAKERGMQMGSWIREEYSLPKWNKVRMQVLESLMN
jgi:hypothetical protein